MNEPTITAQFADRECSLAEIREWESRRAANVLMRLRRRLGPRAAAELLPDLDPSTVATADLGTLRSALRAMKSGLGHAGIYALLARELWVSERVARVATTVSRGRSTHSVTHLSAVGYSAEDFVDWFVNLTDTTTLVDACPDHYLLRALPDGRQEVVETTGGAPTASRFIVDFEHPDPGSVPVDPNYPLQIAGRAVLDDGHVIGGVRHQFRNDGDVLHALLTVEFPASFPRRLLDAHRWHLASEFSNWIIASTHR